MEDRPNNKAVAVGELNNRIFFRLFQTANLMHRMGTQAISELGVTTQQWSVLGALSRPKAADGMTVGELSSYLMVSRQNITGLLNRLEAAGYIEKAHGEQDRRTRRIRLSAAGEKLWDALTPLIHSFYDQSLHPLSFEDRISLLHYLNKLRDSMAKLDTPEA